MKYISIQFYIKHFPEALKCTYRNQPVTESFRSHINQLHKLENKDHAENTSF